MHWSTKYTKFTKKDETLLVKYLRATIYRAGWWHSTKNFFVCFVPFVDKQFLISSMQFLRECELQCIGPRNSRNTRKRQNSSYKNVADGDLPGKLGRWHSTKNFSVFFVDKQFLISFMQFLWGCELQCIGPRNSRNTRKRQNSSCKNIADDDLSGRLGRWHSTKNFFVFFVDNQFLISFMQFLRECELQCLGPRNSRKSRKKMKLFL